MTFPANYRYTSEKCPNQWAQAQAISYRIHPRQRATTFFGIVLGESNGWTLIQEIPTDSRRERHRRRHTKFSTMARIKTEHITRIADIGEAKPDQPDKNVNNEPLRGRGIFGLMSQEDKDLFTQMYRAKKPYKEIMAALPYLLKMDYCTRVAEKLGLPRRSTKKKRERSYRRKGQ